VAESAGGEAGFESAPGAGSTFWFTIPAASNTEARVGTPAAIEASPAPTGLSFLVFVHDKQAERQLADLLEPFGNTLQCAEGVADAVARAARGRFDLIIAAASDADTLAAAPGFKAPLLAVVKGGERTPACADALLRWPAPAREIYAAIHAILDRGRKEVSAEPPLSSAATIDPSAFAELEKSFGAVKLVEILKSYIASAEALCRALNEASNDANWPEATRLAQDIAGSAGGLGLTAMTAAARGFAQAARDGAPPGDLRNTAQLIVWEHERVRRSLINLYPDLAA
jgi:HPt (histidine-containing phosphotransfer) domain-containing protein